MVVKLLIAAACFCGSLSASAQYFDTLHLQYDIGVHTLDHRQMQTLDSLVRHAGGKKLLIYSYADYLGSESPNQHLSDRRAFAVRDYLQQKGMDAGQIMECTGLGQVPGSGSSQGDQHSRRTDIFIRRHAPPKPQTPTAVTPAANRSAPVSPLAPGASPGVTQIDLDQMKVGDALRMTNISFYPGRPDVLPASYPELDNLYHTLDEHPSLKIRLEGHVCCCIYPDGYVEGTPTWNLSVNRALTIYHYLVGKGIEPERLQYQGFGRTRPIRDHERTSEEGQINRRVEIRILEL